MNIALWIVQILLALLFLFAGGTKLILPSEVLQSMGSPNQIMLPGLLLKFIGLCEVLGALGLILPGLLRKRPSLIPLAAAGLVIIMIGAVVITIAGDGVAAGIFPLIVLILCAFVAYGRSRLVPHSGA
ncbi:MAG TPA: DoxX family protein [Pyrinomonadaceae bacterium]|nr:DoxX family protein [Pyrinomonadaceae bacterium]